MQHVFIKRDDVGGVAVVEPTSGRNTNFSLPNDLHSSLSSQIPSQSLDGNSTVDKVIVNASVLSRMDRAEDDDSQSSVVVGTVEITENIDLFSKETREDGSKLGSDQHDEPCSKESWIVFSSNRFSLFVSMLSPPTGLFYINKTTTE
jgi:hypothetical protein